jgi:hypothetical protein|nr:serine protease [uncultured Acetatifactor sp.]
MDERMKGRLKKQTVKIQDSNGMAKGSGFFVGKNKIMTAEHCIPRDEDGKYVNKIYLCTGTGQTLSSKITPEIYGGMALVLLWKDLPLEEDFFPLGYCNSLIYGDKVDIYGYPRKAPKGFPLDRIEIGENSKGSWAEPNMPTLKCFVRNIVGGLDTYEGLSGSPVVFQGHIVGMVAKEDEGGTEANAIHLLDFSLYRDLLSENLTLAEVIRQERKKLDRTALYSQAWWLRRPYDKKPVPIAADRYSIVLASMLLGMEGNANVILASPWEGGLAEVLQGETNHYQDTLPKWRGRQWSEYDDGALPDWPRLADKAGVVIDIPAKEPCGNLILQALTGRKGGRKDILLLFNIFSLDAREANARALEEAKVIEAHEGYDLLTVSPASGTSDEEDISTIVATHDAAKAWLEEKGPEFFCDGMGGTINPVLWESLDIDGINALAWEISLLYQDGLREEWAEAFHCFWWECSDSMRELMTYAWEGRERPDFAVLDLWDLRRWFRTLNRKGCEEALCSLRTDRAMYWTAILSNPYCTEYVLQELCEPEKALIAEMVLDQQPVACSDVALKDSGEFLRKQIRRYL